MIEAHHPPPLHKLIFLGALTNFLGGLQNLPDKVIYDKLHIILDDQAPNPGLIRAV